MREVFWSGLGGCCACCLRVYEIGLGGCCACYLRVYEIGLGDGCACSISAAYRSCWLLWGLQCIVRLSYDRRLLGVLSKLSAVGEAEGWDGADGGLVLRALVQRRGGILAGCKEPGNVFVLESARGSFQGEAGTAQGFNLR